MIREARESDASAIGRIHVETWQATYPGLLPDQMLVRMSDVRHAASWAQMLSDHDTRRRVLVAQDDVGRNGAVVGFASFGPARQRPALPAGRDWLHAGEIYTLYVHPDRQNEGFGRALLAESLKRMRHSGAREAIVWVVAANAARFFYERCGGTRVAVQTERLGGADVEELAYSWRLDDGGQATRA